MHITVRNNLILHFCVLLLSNIADNFIKKLEQFKGSSFLILKISSMLIACAIVSAFVVLSICF